jgi:hypothetical protein
VASKLQQISAQIVPRIAANSQGGKTEDILTLKNIINDHQSTSFPPF